MTANSTNNLRSRWAAVGAAVAITLGGGGIGLVHATVSSGPMAIYQPITPCRLADTRPATLVGTRATPVGAAETWVLDGWGTHGQCTLPASGISALELNVTALNATVNTYVKVYPTGATPGETANLNPQAGGGPVPNSVTAPLNATTGQFSVYNNAGQVNVVIDVVGYYEDHIHSSVDITNEAGIVSSFMTDVVNATSTPAGIASVSIRVPSDGFVEVQATGHWFNFAAGTDSAMCQLQKGTATTIDETQPWFLLDDRSTSAGWTGFSAHRVIPIAVADNPALFAGQGLSLVCDETAGDLRLADIQMSATFFPTSYAPFSFPVITIPIGP